MIPAFHYGEFIRYGGGLMIGQKFSEHSDEAILFIEVSDEALEAAASRTVLPSAAMSFPNAPTVSIFIMCCGNGERAGD